MSGRGLVSDQKGRRRWGGRGRGSPPPARAREALKSETKLEAKFKGIRPDLPSLNYGASQKENRPIEFLQKIEEHCAVTYKSCIAQAYWTSPPTFDDIDDGPIMPVPIANKNIGKAMLEDYTSDKKEWKLENKKIDADIKFPFALTYGQTSESSRSKVEDHEDWAERFAARDLLYLITRIRSTHIARQSGNPRQDMERVRTLWLTLKQQPHEIRFAFRKRVEDYQLERASVGLPATPDGELVIGTLKVGHFTLRRTSQGQSRKRTQRHCRPPKISINPVEGGQRHSSH